MRPWPTPRRCVICRSSGQQLPVQVHNAAMNRHSSRHIVWAFALGTLLVNIRLRESSEDGFCDALGSTGHDAIALMHEVSLSSGEEVPSSLNEGSHWSWFRL